jgi:hypothetical protein
MIGDKTYKGHVELHEHGIRVKQFSQRAWSVGENAPVIYSWSVIKEIKLDDPQDRLIKRLAIGVVAGLVAGFLIAAGLYAWD